MSIHDKAARAVAAVGSLRLLLALVVAFLLLGLSLWGNVTQWADHRAYVKNEKARLEAAANKAGLQVAAALAKDKPKDDQELQAAVGRIERRVNALQTKPRPPALPAQCAPGQKRMDDVNAGADK